MPLHFGRNVVNQLDAWITATLLPQLMNKLRLDSPAHIPALAVLVLPPFDLRELDGNASSAEFRGNYGNWPSFGEFTAHNPMTDLLHMLRFVLRSGGLSTASALDHRRDLFIGGDYPLGGAAMIDGYPGGVCLDGASGEINEWLLYQIIAEWKKLRAAAAAASITNSLGSHRPTVRYMTDASWG